MPTYKTPGVYIEEVSVFPPSVAPVATAIPAFVGFTEKAENERGDSLENVPTRIKSLREYERLFGFPVKKELAVAVTEGEAGIGVTYSTDPGLPADFLHYSMRLYFANGGGPCYVVSVGAHDDLDDTDVFKDDTFIAGIQRLEAFDEPTLIVFPDACLLADYDQYADVVDAALAHCKKMKDRFTIADVRRAFGSETVDNALVTSRFREKIVNDIDSLKYGAAYFPYLRTSIPFHADDDSVKIASHSGGASAIDADSTLASIKISHTAVYNAVKRLVADTTVLVPPSGALAGVYARVDRDRGVWKAPANVSLSEVIEPAVRVDVDLNDDLNIDTASGRSVNVIRFFAGKGPLVWGARTLAGNDNENRYISVRRFLNFAEESIGKAIERFVFDPNDGNTWTKVRAMIENFLTIQWRDGALQGAKSGDAFEVAVGLNRTMSAQDILDGLMIVEVKLAIVRPAEFIVLKFIQKMPVS